MSADIETRMRDYFERQARAFTQIEEDLMRWAARPRPWHEDELAALEDMQYGHAAITDPLREEFRCLSKESLQAKLPEGIDEALRRGVRELACHADRVHALQCELESHATAQLAVIGKSIDELRRGLKHTRDYAGPAGDEANHIDRNA
jgi:hypothetical protein